MPQRVFESDLFNFLVGIRRLVDTLMFAGTRLSERFVTCSLILHVFRQCRRQHRNPVRVSIVLGCQNLGLRLCVSISMLLHLKSWFFLLSVLHAVSSTSLVIEHFKVRIIKSHLAIFGRLRLWQKGRKSDLARLHYLVFNFLGYIYKF